MQYKLQTFLAAALFLANVAHAQTLSTFDDLELPGENTDYCSGLAETGAYTFTSGDVIFHGAREAWGGYGAFNYTNIVDTATEDFTNDKAAIAGSGYDGSENYGVAYANADWPDNPTESIQIGARLTGAAEGNIVSGMYVTNTTYAYYYMKESYSAGDSYRLIVRGFLEGVQSEDSVSFTLASYTADDTILVKTWEWMDLAALGHVDSLTFQVVSTDDFTPFYFAIDNLTTTPDCPVPGMLAVSGITETSATITWEGSAAGYEIAVDGSATLAPEGTPETITADTYNAEELSPATTYYAHIRAACGDGSYSGWDTVSFSTQEPSSLEQISLAAVSVSPNPATDILHINTPAAINAVVYGIDGKQLIAEEQVRNIDISGLPAGNYLLRVTVPGSRQTGIARFIKIN